MFTYAYIHEAQLLHQHCQFSVHAIVLCITDTTLLVDCEYEIAQMHMALMGNSFSPMV